MYIYHQSETIVYISSRASQPHPPFLFDKLIGAELSHLVHLYEVLCTRIGDQKKRFFAVSS